ncbi:helix-turn-helix domain-containing protein [Segetibacter sp. 3557_3]|uniref:helix-turn-helix domain-containing protein n=1 Tax=Segetibacter sp. 3557_3 TaxID=2547429 RepID=UPI001058D9AA|nr:helix-turn-helix transcriptional regulator [Segetibacter sp. 3557_3]TDH21645.1 helix-turn-helix domain-containing protein [Segetibacter sp. 3557_3]
MSKQQLPVYSICSLTKTPQLPNDCIADDFKHYLEVHKDLHFPHKHSFYHLVYFSEGSGSHSIDFLTFPVHPGQIYFMVPGQVHTWEFDNGPNGYIINFSEQYLSALIQNPRYLDQFTFFSGQAKEQVIDIPLDGRNQVEQTLAAIVREANSTNNLKDDFVRAALVQLFIQVNRYTQTGGRSQLNNYNRLLLRNFQKLIEQHFKEKKLSKEYAAMLYVTPNHLNALTKDITGLSAGELIRDRIILEAKRLLVNADMSIMEIANDLDFLDNSYFSKFFKKYVGVTPEIFRKQIHKT